MNFTSIEEYEATLRKLQDIGFSRHMAKDFLFFRSYGMDMNRLFKRMGEQPAINLAEAYRPEGIP